MKKSQVFLLSVMWFAAPFTQAKEIWSDGDTKVDANLLAVHAWLNSRKNYDGTAGGSTWREGYIKYGLGAEQTLVDESSVYGAFNYVSSGTWGDGDAVGATDGSERTTKLDEAYAGWRSGNLFPELGKDGLDLSFGRQIVRIGDGFLLNDDGVNMGNGLADGEFNRGGVYYLAARHGFEQTALMKLGGTEGLHGSAMWLKSDNRFQAKTEMAAGALEYTNEKGTLGLTLIHGLDVDEKYASDFLMRREGMNIYSVRGAGDMGFKDYNFAFEYAQQQDGGNTETGWYVEAGKTFPSVTWSPNVTYRFTRYSENWDMFFSGGSRGYGTWFQGEVASNYAGPFLQNSSIHRLAVKVSPSESINVGAIYYKFKTLENRNVVNLDADELDLYLEWALTENVSVSPLVGLYKPKKSALDGGSQFGDNNVNVYSQLIVAFSF